MLRQTSWAILLLLFGTLPVHATSTLPASMTPGEVLFRAIANEARLVSFLQNRSPRVETYIQDFAPQSAGGENVATDNYFLGRVYFSRKGINDLVFKTIRTGGFGVHFSPRGFAQMIVLDPRHFDAKHYIFRFAGRAFLGDVRCLMYDVYPKKGGGKGLFEGRIWVEDRNDNIVRFKGTYLNHPMGEYYFHFDSWRENIRPDLWLPVSVYSEESDLKALFHTFRFRGMTRLWGYDLHPESAESEDTQLQVDAASKAVDRSSATDHYSPLQSQRAWQQEAEDNLVERLTVAGLLAPPGEVSDVLNSVVENLEISNNLNIQPPVRCRVLMTTPLESFTIGHHIVLSRGLIDALPDQASLAAMIAHEMAHLLLGHGLDTMFAFNDRIMFPDEYSLELHATFHHTPEEEAQADAKAIELLRRSPYAKDLPKVGLFLEQVQAVAPSMPQLMHGYLGDGLFYAQHVRLEQLLSGAEPLQPKNLKQIAALPLGERVDLNPWTDQTTLVKNQTVALLSWRDKLPLAVTPLRPYLLYASSQPSPATNTAAATPPAGVPAAQSPQQASPPK
jgi:hypothetical protein